GVRSQSGAVQLRPSAADRHPRGDAGNCSAANRQHRQTLGVSMGNNKTRLTGWAVFTALLMLAVAAIAPQQIPVVLYKLAMVTLGVVLSYWLSRALYPEIRLYQLRGWQLIAAAGVRSIIALACVLGITLGL